MDDQKLQKCVEEVQNGNAPAFSYIVEKYQSLAFHIALPIVKKHEDAEEVVQDAFVKIYRFIHQYNGESRFSSWLYKIVFNTALTKAKLNRQQLLRNEEVSKQYFDNNAELVHLKDDLEFQNLRQYIGLALDRLRPDERLLVTLFYLGEKSIAEIAEITTWKASKCKVKLMRTRQKLKVILANRKDDLL
ncbi:RNA polymerase sigma-70 factor, ECF subfamily [Marivirga sericea]|uniref:RNA polymerase sigma factor n=1 Tax=Marivirga sericea TaxID=1028 RepID=A0A1X7K5L7_9BACT|nr:sigma-70 family RNA polymerase sigma factor [Marivirga sericea]SMG35928.1 RNA polymerase sigma-70 factor, ECF subfamily [Marivirga sericea]